MKCEFCEKLFEKDFIFESAYWRVLLAFNQTYLGRCIIPLKRHCESLADVKTDELVDFKELVKKLESTLSRSFDATMFNWSCLMNNTYKTNDNPHVHWHFIPRYNHRSEFAGFVFEDSEFGTHYSISRKHELPDETRKKIIEKIQECL